MVVAGGAMWGGGLRRLGRWLMCWNESEFS